MELFAFKWVSFQAQCCVWLLRPVLFSKGHLCSLWWWRTFQNQVWLCSGQSHNGFQLWRYSILQFCPPGGYTWMPEWKSLASQLLNQNLIWKLQPLPVKQWLIKLNPVKLLLTRLVTHLVTQQLLTSQISKCAVSQVRGALEEVGGAAGHDGAGWWISPESSVYASERPVSPECQDNQCVLPLPWQDHPGLSAEQHWDLASLPTITVSPAL